MNIILNDFLKMKINLKQLKEKLGNDLYNLNIKAPEIVYANDVIYLINQYILDKISMQGVIEWVNIVWFTDLFEYNPIEEEAIASVISLLETLDEDDVQFSHIEFTNMIKCLSNNKVYKNS